AHRIRQAEPGLSITVYESAPSVGGLASAWSVGPVQWDRYYHVTLTSDAATRGLLRELGLEYEVRWATTRTGCWADGRITPLGTPLEYLRSPVLGPVGKARLATTILWGGRVRDWRRLERTPVADWLQRWSGRATFRRFWLPLLRSKLGDGWTDANAAFIWATIQRLSAARRAGLGGERFGYVPGRDGAPGGYARTLAALQTLLDEEHVDVRCATRVDAVARADQGLVVRTPDDEAHYDDVVVTVAPPVAATLCPLLTEAERDALAAIRYQGVVCTSLVLRRPLDGYYLTYLVDDVPITTVIEMSSLVDPAEYGGHTLVYVPRYVHSDDAALDAPCVVRAARERHAQRQRDDHAGERRGAEGARRHARNGRRRPVSTSPATPRPVASLSFDLDNLWAYRMTHGEHDWTEAPSYLPVVSERALELLDRLGLHITFFVVGRDAVQDGNAAALHALVDAGHEIGNHSFDHRPWMHRWSRDEIDDDIARAEDAITSVLGVRPVAFRGPGYSL